jgi:hypothetical protein
MAAQTFSPDPVRLGTGAGTAAAQAAQPRLVADTVNGGWDPAPIPATGATAGTPGTFTPAGAVTPASRTAMITAGIVATPQTVWTTGQYVATADSQHSHWSGTAWVAGDAALAAASAPASTNGNGK